MQLLRHLTSNELNQRLASGELGLHVGPYIYNIQSNLPTITSGIETLYSDFSLASLGEFVDYDVAILSRGLLQRMRGKVEFLFDKRRPFDVITRGHAYAFLEWGLNWCVSLHANEYLKLHAAAASKGNSTIIMPGIPGAGKSTLCAALGLSGWRILSDEHAMIEPVSTEIAPLCRPVSLKNESIEVIKSFSSSAVFGPTSEETHKGRVAHMKADLHPDSHDTNTLKASTMIFPKYTRDEPQRLSQRRRTDSFVLAAYHSFNYSLLGDAGFDIMKKLINSVYCYDLVYHDLDWAVKTLDELPVGQTDP
jgi:HprK-related kinase A